MARIVSFVTPLLLYLVSLVPALAQVPRTIEPAPGVIASGPTFFVNLLGYIVNFIWTLFLIIAVIFYLWSAYMYLEARGEEERIRRAKNALIWGVVAMAIAFLAFSVETIIHNLLLRGQYAP